MTTRLHGIYVPGLGDGKTHGQDKALQSWQKLGLMIEYHPMRWADSEPFKKKLGGSLLESTSCIKNMDHSC